MALTSHVGIDFGHSASRVAITRRGGVDIVCNETSNRSTPTMVSFGPRERLVGESAAGQAVMNARNTVSELKRLLGRQFADPDTQAELQPLPFKSKPLSDGTVGVEVQYKGAPHTFSCEQLTGVYLGQLKRFVERETNSRCRDVVIACPGWWVDAQRRALIAAADIAGLHCMRLISDLTAVALQYGLFRLDLDPEKPIHVLFIDLGASQLSVAVVAFTKTRLRVLSTSYDTNLGGRDFDALLVRHFAAEFTKKYRIDVTQNVRAMLRLSAACEKLKKTLSANSEAHLNVESIMNDIDVRGEMKRDAFEQLMEPLLDRVVKPIRQALVDAQLTAADLHAAEAIGNGIRLPAVQRRIEAELKRELSKTQNMSESVVKGAALQAAMLSTGARVREYTVQDAYPYPMEMLWTAPVGAAAKSDDRMDLIRVRHAFPLQSTITFHQMGPFEIEVRYADLARMPTAGEPNREAAALIGKWIVDLPPLERKHDVRVKCALPITGLFTVESAQLVESVEVLVDEPKKDEKKEEEKPKDEDKTKKEEEKGKDSGEPMVTDSQPASSQPGTPEAAPKKKTVTQQKLTPVTVRPQLAHALSADALRSFVEAESRMFDDDRLFVETAEKRNQLEEYVLNMKSKLASSLVPYITAEDRTTLLQLLERTEQWLLDDATDDTTKQQFQEKLTPLERLGEPPLLRMREYTVTLPDAFAAARDRLQTARKQLSSRESRHEHIAREERDPLAAELDAVERWLAERETQLNSSATNRTEMPTLTPYELSSKVEKLETQVRSLMNRPKPEPPKPEPPKSDAPPKADSQSDQTGPPPPPPPTGDGPQMSPQPPKHSPEPSTEAEKEKKAKIEADVSGDKKPMDLD